MNAGRGGLQPHRRGNSNPGTVCSLKGTKTSTCSVPAEKKITHIKYRLFWSKDLEEKHITQEEHILIQVGKLLFVHFYFFF